MDGRQHDGNHRIVLSSRSITVYHKTNNGAKHGERSKKKGEKDRAGCDTNEYRFNFKVTHVSLTVKHEQRSQKWRATTK